MSTPAARMCLNKKRFSTEHVAKAIARRHGWLQRAYQCPHCLGWHLTKQNAGAAP